MKFGKRLWQESQRRWTENYFDYKAIKKAIKDDIASQDALGASFQRVLLAELQKVSLFYSHKAEQLEALLANTSGIPSTKLQQLSSEIKELIKFVALNYLAVVKAIKKRNKELQECFGAGTSTSLHALDLLGHEVFFTSPKLATLATQAEVLAQELSCCSQTQPAQLLEDYQCSICLETLHSPVVLTCAHRFCWGCLVAHCTTARSNRFQLDKLKTDANTMHIPATSYRMLEEIAINEDLEPQKFYNCPVCRKPQVLDVDSLQVDSFLSNFIEGLKASSQVEDIEEDQSTTGRVASDASSAVLRDATSDASCSGREWGIIPPPLPRYKGKLTVLLDLDGTLVSSFTPKRAPRLPSSIRTHVVGVGSKLNPAGVFVVERPGLREFLAELAGVAEVIVFTAGLEDYASPIIDAIDPFRAFFAGRIYREGTLRTEYYQCVKDMGRVARDLRRTVLVDDTPLAFLHQPDNGIPVLGFRGDPDDRLLLEAVLPLLQMLSKEPDVREVLQRRFDMCTWFKRNGFPVDAILANATEAALQERLRGGARAPAVASQRSAVVVAASSATAQTAASAPRSANAPPVRPFLLLADFDKTLIDFDAGERVMEHLAPELLPMLIGLETPCNFIPITNTLLSECQRRGVSRDTLLHTLAQLGSEIPPATVQLLQLANAADVHVKVLSDCNSIFINHMLTAAKAAGCVTEVITNPASFERMDGDMPDLSGAMGLGAVSSTAAGGPGSDSSRKSGNVDSAVNGNNSCSHKLVIRPRHGPEQPPHGCPLCPENLCKGAEVRRIRASGDYARVLFTGDGSNDICAALNLGPNDVVLARANFPLARYCAEAARSSDLRKVTAKVVVWETHEELRDSVMGVIRA